jgi:phenol hydroxylase P5 protein
MAFKISLNDGERSALASADQSLLDAFLREGIWLPHNCTQGTCGSCKCRVDAGSFDHGGSPFDTLTQEERDAGIVLACQARAQSDMLIEPLAEIDDSVTHHPMRDVSGRIAVLEDIARDTRRLVIELDAEMPFLAGQYAELNVPGTDVWRQYSMASAPSETRRLEFHIKRTPGGLATDGWLFKSASVGDQVDMKGPLGNFGLFEAQDDPAILIAGGTGLAPMKSIVLHALAHDLIPEIFLYHGGRAQADLYDVEFFRALDTDHPRFHYRPCLSEEAWQERTGMVTDCVQEDFSSCKGMSAYLCGPPAMVEAAGKALKRRRLPPRRTFKEEFTEAAKIAAE